MHDCVLIPLNSGLHLDGVMACIMQDIAVLIPLNSGLHLDSNSDNDAKYFIGLNPFEFRASFGPAITRTAPTRKRLNPFEFRASFGHFYQYLGVLPCHVLIPLNSGLHLDRD